mmetsp:Transcript_37062/g.37726  ORF Transcript_37062/g.37726 Transcript_37062/m.37726 type:complete len:349 (-) Transcript_37062:379-1425(-)|eukprot:CAMPEP_0182416730 /NCGR_PEP_ID=MMETSP1167-20130531/1090_1 /TAXON_ID=2988 /ORGANISM="Mallomonas Sp, Strain CCMP3275" /LENGTH=348 /DNA_ID=CAMNT_0024589755 /DNA_START=138 /DNA_END=1184 /DNA_ORIENTATION=+
MELFRPGDLEDSLGKLYGPKDETAMQMLSRIMMQFKSTLIQPKRMDYFAHDLLPMNASISPYNIRQFYLDASNGKNKCTYWERNPSSSSTAFLYLHTNTRSAADALEIISLCDVLGVNLFAYDLPGCGKSDGPLSFNMSEDLQTIIQWIIDNLHLTEIIIWARGMSTAPVIEYLSQKKFPHYIKYVVLDTPFTSIKSIVDSCVKRVTEKGYYIPRPLVSMFAGWVRRYIRSSLGEDPYRVELLPLAAKCTVPCLILSADNDDYIPISHGNQLAMKWGAQCHYQTFSGTHFSVREEDVVMRAREHLEARHTDRSMSARDSQPAVPDSNPSQDSNNENKSYSFKSFFYKT